MTILGERFRRQSGLHRQSGLQLIDSILETLYLASEMVTLALSINFDNESI
jgi:hypothetical protein